MLLLYRFWNKVFRLQAVINSGSSNFVLKVIGWYTINDRLQNWRNFSLLLINFTELTHNGTFSQPAPVSEKHRCNCGREYTHYFTLVRHKRYECGKKEPNFTCIACGARFKRNDNLTLHIRLKHNLGLRAYQLKWWT